MDSDRPYITKRPHKKSRNGCIQCKQRKQKCDEAQPACTSCKKRQVRCQYPPKPSQGTFKVTSEAATTIEEPVGRENELVLVKSSSSSDGSDAESPSHSGHRSDSISGSTTSAEEIPRTEPEPGNNHILAIAGPSISLQAGPWRNALEHSLYQSYYTTHRETLDKPGIDDATKEIWVRLVPKIALSTDGTLFKLLLSLGSIHLAMKTSDYPSIEPTSEGGKLWNMSNRYFSDAIASFRDSITSQKMYETNPEVFCVIALVLSFRSSMNANHHHTNAYTLYDDLLSWFTASLGYIALGGFYTEKLEGTQLGDIMKANPEATYHFYPFLEYIKCHEFPYFGYLHPMSDPVTGNLEPEDSTDEALNAYTMSLKLIGWVYQAAKGGAAISELYGMFQTVPYTVPSHFLELLRQRRPRAIAVLAHHIALSAFLGVYERLHFWPREHIRLLQTLVPTNWSWAFQKAIDIVEEGNRSHVRPRTAVLPAESMDSTPANDMEMVMMD